jgi:hypothetical protein
MLRGFVFFEMESVLSALAFRLSSHRHSYASLLFSSHFIVS